MAERLNVSVIIGLVNRLSAPLRGVQADLRALGQTAARVGRQFATVGAGMTAAAAAGALALRQAVLPAADLSAALTDIGITADASAARLAAIRPDLRRLAEQSNQTTTALSQGLKDLVAKGLSLEEALAALPAIAKTSTAAGAEMADMSAAASALIGNLKIVPGAMQRTLDILTVAGNEGAFELKDMAKEFPTLTAALAGLQMQGEGAAASLAAALQIAMKGAGSAPEAANNLLNFLSKLTAPETVNKIKSTWGVDVPAAFRTWQQQGLNPVEEMLRLIQARTGGDAFKIGEIFGDMQVLSALKPLLQNIEEYRRIRDAALGGTGASAAQFARRMAEDPTQTWTALTIQVGNLVDRLGVALLPILKQVADKLRPLIDRMAAWIEANPQLTAQLLEWSVLGAGVVAVLGGLGLALGGLLVAVRPVLRVVGLFLGPLRLLGLAVAAVGYAFTHWGEIMKAVGPTLRAVFIEPVKAMFDWLDDLLGGWPQRALAYGRSLIDHLVQGVKDAWSGMLSWVRSLDILPDWVKRLLGIGDPPPLPVAAPPAVAPSPAGPAPAGRDARVIVPPPRSLAEAAAMAERLSRPGRLPERPLPRTLGGSVQRWLSGLPGAVVAGTLATAPARAGPPPGSVAPSVHMPITITLQIPPGADEQRLAALVRRAVEDATTQASRRLAGLYDGSDR